MKTIKIVWLSIIRRKAKSFILFSIVFLMGNILCASLSISNSMEQLKEEFIKQVGYNITISSNPQYYGNKSYETNNQQLMNKLVDDIEKDREHNGLQYSDKNLLLDGLGSDNLIFQNNYIYQESNVYNGLLIYGISENKMVDILNNKIEMTEGRLFTESEMESGAKVLIIGEDYTYNNEKIKIGQKIPLSKVIIDKSNKEIKETELFEIVGIFKKKDVLDNDENYKVENYAARIYMPNKAILNTYEQMKNMKEKYPDAIQSFFLEMYQINFKFNNSQKENYITNFIEQNEELNKLYTIKTGKRIYDLINAPLNALSSTSNMLTKVSIISMIGLLSCTIFIFLKDRRYEVGVLYSMGEKRIKIVMQHLLEVLIISLTAITIAMYSGMNFANAISNKIIDQQIENSNHSIIEGYSQEEYLKKYETSMNKEFFVKVYGSITIIVVVSSLLPISYLLRLNPKKILLDIN